MTKILIYKTNIKCNGCIATIAPYFKKEQTIKEWSVDLENPNRLLTIQLVDGDSNRIESLISEAGFEAELI